jgi:hypothetical protein
LNVDSTSQLASLSGCSNTPASMSEEPLGNIGAAGQPLEHLRLVHEQAKDQLPRHPQGRW